MARWASRLIRAISLAGLSAGSAVATAGAVSSEAGSPGTPVKLVQNLDASELKATTDRLPIRVNIHRALANSPPVFAAFVELTQTLRFKTVLDAADRELAILHVLQRHEGHYEFEKHKAGSLGAGLLSEEQIANLRDYADATCFTDRQKAVLGFAERFGADPSERHKLRPDHIEKYLNDRELVELGVTLAWYLGLAHFTGTIDVPNEEQSVMQSISSSADLGQSPRKDNVDPPTHRR